MRFAVTIRGMWSEATEDICSGIYLNWYTDCGFIGMGKCWEKRREKDYVHIMEHTITEMCNKLLFH